MAKKLTKKQEVFVAEYIDGLTVTDAASLSDFEFEPIPASGWYVYFLIDPRNDRIFYVGKGKGHRISQHVKGCWRDTSVNSVKDQRIREILQSGNSVIERVFSVHGWESNAFTVERILIHALREHGLTNISGGVVGNCEKAEALLARVKPFDVWIATTPPEILNCCTRVIGEPREFYDKFVSALRGLAREPQVRVIHYG